MLKNLILIILLSVFMILTALPQIAFEKMIHDFGQLKEEVGEVSYDFQFTNTGDEPLKLENVKAS